jgi:hypothetical protein
MAKTTNTNENGNCANRALEAVNLIKDNVAKRHGYPDNIIGTRWEYAMMITHRTKLQIRLYEEALVEFAFNSL